MRAAAAGSWGDEAAEQLQAKADAAPVADHR